MIRIHEQVDKNYYENSLQLILDNYSLIKKDLLEIPKEYYKVIYQIQNVVEGNNQWTYYPLIYKKRILDFERLANFTTSLLSDIGVINAGFSLLYPKSKTTLHKDQSPYTYRCHMGLTVPEKSYFLLDNKDFTAKEKEITLFSIELEHVAVNDSEEDRYILLIDFLKPNIDITNLFARKNIK